MMIRLKKKKKVFADKKCRVDETGIHRMSRVGKRGISEIGVDEMGPNHVKHKSGKD